MEKVLGPDFETFVCTVFCIKGRGGNSGKPAIFEKQHLFRALCKPTPSPRGSFKRLAPHTQAPPHCNCSTTEQREDLSTVLSTLLNYVTSCLIQRYENTVHYHNDCKKTNMVTERQQPWNRCSGLSSPSVVAIAEKLYQCLLWFGLLLYLKLFLFTASLLLCFFPCPVPQTSGDKQPWQWYFGSVFFAIP